MLTYTSIRLETYCTGTWESRVHTVQKETLTLLWLSFKNKKTYSLGRRHNEKRLHFGEYVENFHHLKNVLCFRMSPEFFEEIHNLKKFKDKIKTTDINWRRAISTRGRLGFLLKLGNILFVKTYFNKFTITYRNTDI